MWKFYSVPLWRQMLEWWQGRPGEPVVMRRRIGRDWEFRALTAAEHAERRRIGLC